MFLQAKKSLGQHFLNSKHVLSQIIDAAKITKGETILEIGPGTGFLTEALLGTGAIVIAVEKDARAIELLEIKFKDQVSANQLKIVHGDVLEDSEKFIPQTPYSVVANIPYYITGAILEKFLELGPRPRRMILLVQKEVAERITTKDKKESILSVSVKVFGEPKILAKVPRGAFTPAPTVDSAILAIENISDKKFAENELDIPRFFNIIKAGFAHKRKYLIRNLESLVDKKLLEKIWIDLNIDGKERAENVSPETWLLIARRAVNKTSSCPQK